MQINEPPSMRPADALISILKHALSPDEGQPFAHAVLYTSFGVVRGRTGLSFAQGLADANNDDASGITEAVIELNEVTVEHYSNHLPSASFDRLYIRLADVRGFALVSLQGQS